MNERIKELAEQAGITTNLDTDYFEKDFNKWLDYYSEKFAKLIIQECANYIRENYDSWDAEPLAHNMEVDFGLHGDYAE
jgi:uncharacterized membrane-anchored protein YjiN (DUF445 family)